MAFSPDSQWLAFMGPNEFTYMRDEQIYAVPVAGGSPRPLIENFGGDVNGFFWSKDGKAVFFVAGVGVNQQLFSVPASGGPAKQLTSVTGTVSPLRGEELSPDTPSDLLVFTVNSPSAPADLYVARLGDIESGSSGPDRWKRITNINPQTQRFELDELRRKIQDANRRRLFQAGLRRYHHWCRLPDSAWDRRSGQIGNDGMECWRPLVQLDSDAYRSIQSHLVGSRSRQLGFYVCSDRSTAASRVLFQGKAV